MAPLNSGAEFVYGVVEMPYRNPASCDELPELSNDSNQCRASIPSRPGWGTPVERIGRPKLTPVSMLNGRTLLAANKAPNLDEHAFSFVTQATRFQDWDNPASVRDHYLPEVEAIVRSNVPGAEQATVLIFDHALRTGGKELKHREQDDPESGWNRYANLVHTDATVRSIHTRCKDQVMGTTETVVKYDGVYPSSWGEVRPTKEWQRRLFRAESEDHDSPDGSGGEHLIVNVWRPLSTVRNWGLAALDGSSLDQGDVHPSVIIKFDNSPGGRTGGDMSRTSKVVDVDGQIVPVRIGETMTPLHKPEHRWCYFPEMTSDEVLLLKVFDSRKDGRTRCGCHSAFKDPKGDPTAHRESIEVRCLVILPSGDGLPASKL